MVYHYNVSDMGIVGLIMMCAEAKESNFAAGGRWWVQTSPKSADRAFSEGCFQCKKVRTQLIINYLVVTLHNFWVVYFSTFWMFLIYMFDMSLYHCNPLVLFPWDQPVEFWYLSRFLFFFSRFGYTLLNRSLREP